MRRILPIEKFAGGTAANEKEGVANSFAYLKCLEVRKNPTLLSVLPKPTKNSGNIVVDLVLNAVKVANGDAYFIGDAGNFYKRTAAGVWSNIGDVGTGCDGLVYRQDLDMIFITKPTEVANYYPVSSSPALTNSKYAAAKDQSATGGAQHYDLTTGINEGATHIKAFTPEIEPLYSIKVWIVAKGSGNWTVTVHDDANNVLVTKTTANASLNNGALNEFVFATVGRMLVKPNARTYHFHLTSSVADGTAMTTTVHDLTTADFETYGQRLIATNNGFHPAIQFMQYLCIGNERYLSVMELLSDTPTNAEWMHHRLVFPPGYEVCGLALYQEFIAIACEKCTSSASSNFQDGKIFFWDGTAGTYNFFIDVPSGSPHSLLADNNVLYWCSNGEWFAWSGGNPQKIRRFPFIDGEYTDARDSVVLNPNMATIRKGVLLQGFPSTTANTNIEMGIYSYGSLDKNYPNVFSYDYLPSHGKQKFVSDPLKIGMIKNFNEDLFISWRDNATYGVDLVNNDSDPSATAELRTLIFDNGVTYKEKIGLNLKCVFKTLPTGATLRLKYKINREANWNYNTVVGAGETESFLAINKRFNEIQFGIDLTCTAATPEIMSLALAFNDNAEEDIL